MRVVALALAGVGVRARILAQQRQHEGFPNDMEQVMGIMNKATYQEPSHDVSKGTVEVERPDWSKDFREETVDGVEAKEEMRVEALQRREDVLGVLSDAVPARMNHTQAAGIGLPHIDAAILKCDGDFDGKGPSRLVTEAVNLLIRANGPRDLFGGKTMTSDKWLYDFAHGKRKILAIRRGSEWFNSTEMAEYTMNVARAFSEQELATLSVYHDSLLRRSLNEATVDMARFRGPNPGKSRDIDVTNLLNAMIKVNGYKNPTGDMPMEAIVGDPDPSTEEGKELFVIRRASDVMMTVTTNDIKNYDLSELFANFEDKATPQEGVGQSDWAQMPGL